VNISPPVLPPLLGWTKAEKMPFIVRASGGTAQKVTTGRTAEAATLASSENNGPKTIHVNAIVWVV
jgi:hypothetical protein